MDQNIILIVIDTARADIVHEMMENGSLPNLQQLADTGLNFTNAIAQGPWTFPSHASLFTGEYPTHHRAHAGTKQFNPKRTTLAETFSNNGYETAGISGNIWISEEFGFARGFDNFSIKYERFWSGSNLSGVANATSKKDKIKEFTEAVNIYTIAPTLANGIYTKLLAGKKDKGGANTTRRTQTWLKKRSQTDRGFFYFINYLEPHLEYQPQKKYAEPFLPDEISYDEALEIPQRPWEYITGNITYTDSEFEILEALYRGEMAYTDHQTGRVLDTLEKTGLNDETSIIVVGDHGENIGDYGLMDHQYCLYQTLVHVPLLISGPTIEEQTVTGPVEIRDIYPTALELAGIEQEQEEQKSTNSLLEDPERKYACSEYLAPQPSMESLEETGTINNRSKLDRTLRAVQTDRWKFIEDSNGDTELYNINIDPMESKNVSQESEDVVEELCSYLDGEGLLINYQKAGEYDAADATRDRLEDLGYL